MASKPSECVTACSLPGAPLLLLTNPIHHLGLGDNRLRLELALRFAHAHRTSF